MVRRAPGSAIVALSALSVGLALISVTFASCVRPTYERSSASVTRHGRSSGGERVDAGPAEGADAGAPIDADAGVADGAVDGGVVLEVLEGRASYYSDRFEGHSTASGEPYRARELTAASRDLPFGTIVRVTRIETGASVVVRINDRGPFGDRERILDLSRAAAEALDMTRIGVVDVRAEILERGDGRRTR
jgi:hypothetical protein